MSDTPNKGSGGYNFNNFLPPDFHKSIAKMMQQITASYTPIIKEIQLFSGQQSAISKAISNLTKDIDLSAISNLAKTLASDFSRTNAHFPENWKTGQIDDAVKLSMQGIPTIFIPSGEIIDKMHNAKSMAGVKQVLIHNDDAIIADCETVINECDWLPRSMKDHISEGISSYKNGLYRAPQSTATVAFDSLLNDIIDIKFWRKTNGKPKELSSKHVKKLADELSNQDLMNLPISKAPFYTLLMFPIIGQMLSPFEIGDKTTLSKDANRHATIHTVSEKQYKRSNALLVIMTVASICKVTQLRGKNWMQTSAKVYGYNI